MTETETIMPCAIILNSRGRLETTKFALQNGTTMLIEHSFFFFFVYFSHPIAAFFFLAFRLGAIFTYLFGSLFSGNFTLIFVVTILLLAFDFWTVKNISGRLLVGLRWWNEIQPDGSNKWVFESAHVSSAFILISS